MRLLRRWVQLNLIAIFKTSKKDSKSFMYKVYTATARSNVLNFTLWLYE